MTLKRSSYNLKLDFRLFLFTLKKNIGFSAVASALVFLLSPLYLYKDITDKLKYDTEVNIYRYFLIFAVLMAIGSVLFFIIMQYVNFSFLYKKNRSDMYHSMPLKRSELLISKFLASFVSSVIPVLVGYGGFISLYFIKGVIAEPIFYLKIMLINIVLLLFCGLFSLIFVISSGTVFDSVVAFLSVNVGVMLVVFIYNALINTNLEGLSSYLNNMQNTIVFSTPYGFSIYILVNSLIANKIVFPLSYIIAAVVIGVILLALNLILYNKRKSERCQINFAFKFMPIVIGFLVSFLGYYFVGVIFNASTILTSFVSVYGVIGAVLFGIIYSVITYRGFKQIKKALIVSVSTCLAIVLLFASVYFDVFNIEYYVPNINKISSVSITYLDQTFTPQNIEDAINMHKEIVNSNFKKNYHRETYGDIEIRYTLKGGKNVLREYSQLDSKVAENQKLLFLNRDIPNSIQQKFNNDRSNVYEIFSQVTFGLNPYDADIPRSLARKLINAIILDYKNIKSVDDISGEVYHIGLYSASNSYHEFVYVYSSFTNTIECLKQLKEEVYIIDFDLEKLQGQS